MIQKKSSKYYQDKSSKNQRFRLSKQSNPIFFISVSEDNYFKTCTIVVNANMFLKKYLTNLTNVRITTNKIEEQFFYKILCITFLMTRRIFFSYTQKSEFFLNFLLNAAWVAWRFLSCSLPSFNSTEFYGQIDYNREKRVRKQLSCLEAKFKHKFEKWDQIQLDIKMHERTNMMDQQVYSQIDKWIDKQIL